MIVLLLSERQSAARRKVPAGDPAKAAAYASDADISLADSMIGA